MWNKPTFYYFILFYCKVKYRTDVILLLFNRWIKSHLWLRLGGNYEGWSVCIFLLLVTWILKFRSHVQWRIGHLYIDFTVSVQLFTRVAHLWWIRWDRTAFTWRKTSSYLNEFSIRLHDHVESLRCIGVHMTRIISENRRYILITCRLTSTEGPPTPARWSRYMHNTSSFIYFAYLLIVHVV